MLSQKPIKFVLIMVLIVGFFPVIGWAGPSLLTDEDMDGIYAKGIFVNFEINIALPGGNMFSIPSISIPDASGWTTSTPVTPSSTPVASVGTTSTPVTTSSTPVASVGTTSTPVTPSSTPVASVGTTSAPVSVAPPTNKYSYPGAGIFVTDNAMQGNSGLMINAPNSAVSMTISVVVLNNSTVNGGIFQSSTSYPTNLFLSLKSYMQ